MANGGGNTTRIWQGRRLVLACCSFILPGEPGEDKPSPLPYSVIP
ncbi:hypothetical protein [Reticulibacter mediterranei]|nr:hypothetical protein [Reticulibacter mediterranei]